ncbi:hypothetical protein L4C38_20590 [Vibrio kasasachensis]|uniref:hypothetical protein n=1 Tax=Vibrio kasasachensis TaxID=2910248 RepID=UPI003D0E28FD
MIDELEQWVESTVAEFVNQAQSCSILHSEIGHYYPLEFLECCYFVVIDEVPKPPIGSISDPNIVDFISMRVAAITYKNIYFIKPRYINEIHLHVHELVHVVQWNKLGVKGFIERYINELNKYKYADAPLEVMAYHIGEQFTRSRKAFDVHSYVEQQI